MRDALADILQGEAQYAAVVDREGRIAASSRSRSSPSSSARREAKTEEHGAVERPHGVTALRSPPSAKSARASSRNAAPTPCPARRPTSSSASTGRRKTSTATGRRQSQHLNWSRLVVLGFAIAFTLALLAHRRRWLQSPLLAATGVLYTIPSVAFFFLLLPSPDAASTPRSSPSPPSSCRSSTATRSSASPTSPARSRTPPGHGPDRAQVLWRVELPLATPEIIAGLRIATVSTVAIATLAVFAGGGGLGEPIYASGSTSRPTSSSPAGSRS